MDLLMSVTMVTGMRNDGQPGAFERQRGLSGIRRDNTFLLLDMCATKDQHSHFATFGEVYAYNLMHMFNKSNVCTKQNALQLPLQRTSARRTQHSIGNQWRAPVKCLDTPTNSRVFLYFYCFLHCRIIMKTSNL